MAARSRARASYLAALSPTARLPLARVHAIVTSPPYAC